MSGRRVPGRGPGRGMDRKSSFARSFFSSGEGENGEEAQLDDSVPVPRSRPLGRLASRRNLSIAKRPSMMSAPSQRGIEATRSGDSLSSAAASLASAGGGAAGKLSSPVAVAAAPPRNAEENWLRQSMLRSSGAASGGGGAIGFDMNAIDAALKEDEALEAGFDDEEVLEQYRIMAQHEATLRVKANTGFDMADYEKRRKVQGNENKDKKELYGGGKKPKLGLPPPQHVLSSLNSNHNGNSHSHSGVGGFSAPPSIPLSQKGGYGFTNGSSSACISDNYMTFLEEQHTKAQSLPELSQGEIVRNTQTAEGEHVVRCWGCRLNLRVNYVATLVQCPECKTVSQARKRA
ncbi:expressed unknown protein [Seminavis robusta]|uniref:Uncharacterized protein n=1 Tax=Seminavis robusta TaxID=568900 RepID=A0A9N8HSF3_9STRA|nr:expressed unknown protein [Seminavis robusta]|eukprot:Sro1162_g247880.1 n/a (347) ;mRNA; f:13998-15038